MKKTLAAIALSLASMVALAQSPDYADSKANFAVEKDGGQVTGGYVDYSTSQTQNTFLAAPCASNGAPVFRLFCTDGSDGDIVGQGSTPGTQQTINGNFNISGKGIAASGFEVPSNGTFSGTALGKFTVLSTDGAFEVSKATPDNTAQFSFGCALTSACTKISTTATNIGFFSGNGGNTGVTFSGVRRTNASKTADYTLTAVDGYVRCDATSGNIIFTLPTAVSSQGQQYTMIKTDATANTCTMTRGSTNLIDGVTSLIATSQGDEVTVTEQIVGTNNESWHVTGGNIRAAALTDGIEHCTVNETNQKGGQWLQCSMTELLTLSTGGLTTDTTANLHPAGAIMDAVTVRVTTAITTTTDWAVGDSGASARYCSANSTKTAGTTSVCMNQWNGALASTLALSPTNTSTTGVGAASKIRITCTGSNPGAGAVRVTSHYRRFVGPNVNS